MRHLSKNIAESAGGLAHVPRLFGLLAADSHAAAAANLIRAGGRYVVAADAVLFTKVSDSIRWRGFPTVQPAAKAFVEVSPAELPAVWTVYQED